MVARRHLAILGVALGLMAAGAAPVAADGGPHGLTVSEAARSGFVAPNANGVVNHGAFMREVAHPPSPCSPTVCTTDA
jgi:hypothetical protein